MQNPDVITQTGDWLYKELLTLGCAEELAHDICFAMGQRMAMMTDGDLWECARTTLANYKRGVWDTPGIGLAEQLIREAWGDPPDKAAMLQWLEQRLKKR